MTQDAAAHQRYKDEVLPDCFYFFIVVRRGLQRNLNAIKN